MLLLLFGKHDSVVNGEVKMKKTRLAIAVTFSCGHTERLEASAMLYRDCSDSVRHH